MSCLTRTRSSVKLINGDGGEMLWNKATIFQNSKNFKSFASLSYSLISRKRRIDSVTAKFLVYKDEPFSYWIPVESLQNTTFYLKSKTFEIVQNLLKYVFTKKHWN